VVVTRNGKPVAVIVGVQDEDEIEDLLLAHSPRLRAILEESRKQIREGEMLGHEQFWAEVEAQRVSKQRGRKRKVPVDSPLPIYERAFIERGGADLELRSSRKTPSLSTPVDLAKHRPVRRRSGFATRRLATSDGVIRSIARDVRDQTLAIDLLLNLSR
jgi:hypothetical protein